MGQRLQLQALLASTAEIDNVYFQPPPSVQMVYPCIVYHREYEMVDHANNGPYKIKKRYLITIIDRDPDGDIGDKIAALPLCAFDRFYTADNLNHDVYKLYF